MVDAEGMTQGEIGHYLEDLFIFIFIMNIFSTRIHNFLYIYFIFIRTICTYAYNCFIVSFRKFVTYKYNLVFS